MPPPVRQVALHDPGTRVHILQTGGYHAPAGSVVTTNRSGGMWSVSKGWKDICHQVLVVWPGSHVVVEVQPEGRATKAGDGQIERLGMVLDRLAQRAPVIHNPLRPRRHAPRHFPRSPERFVLVNDPGAVPSPEPLRL